MYTLQIYFDATHAGISYGVYFWRKFWEAVNPADVRGSVLYAGDAPPRLTPNQRIFCISVQNPSRGPLLLVKAAIALHPDRPAIHVTEGEAMPVRALLVRAGEVTNQGQLVDYGFGWTEVLCDVRPTWRSHIRTFGEDEITPDRLEAYAEQMGIDLPDTEESVTMERPEDERSEQS